MNKHNKRKGLALAVILFFAFAIAIVLFTVIKSNSNLAFQNKNTIRALQATYLVHSAMQHAKLHLNLLPRESNEFFKANPYSTNALDTVEASKHVPLSLNGNSWDKKMASYDLFTQGKCDIKDFPFAGNYKVTSTECLNIDSNVRLIQDVYRVKVEATVTVGNNSFTDTLEEEFSISRYSGG
jgi:type II secretory pathway component PulK